ncbi:hypothetical protein CY35_01G170700 [Sphagnum magellanicum]|nr:hypothetical protein CY35_01G170700 [Sphagnum magellanicum]
MAPVGIERVNPLIESELDYDREALHAHVERSLPLLNKDQDRAVASILNAVRLDQGGVFSLDGPNGSGKTFVYNILLASIRNEGHVALVVASSSIAALLLQGGRTSHSAFKIPIDVHRDSLCNVNANSDTAELIQAAKLIVWDEAPAQHRHCAEVVDRTFRYVLQQAESPFGRKVIVFGGNFRQCPPVVARGSRPAIVGAALKRSVLWRHVQVLALTENMRLRDDPASRPYAEYILRVGDGTEPSVLEKEVPFLPHGNVAPSASVEIGLFPGNAHRANLDGYMDGRAILTAKNVVVNQINTDIVIGMLGDEHVFFSADIVEAGDNRAYEIATKFLNTITLPGMPPHRLALKVGVPVILLRNLDASSGLCNGTCLIVQRLARRLIVAEIVGGSHVGTVLNIPPITTSSTGNHWPFTLLRRQFPVQLAFAMTINKAQGQTVGTVGIYLPELVFTHGQLYVALSRATNVGNVSMIARTRKAQPMLSTSSC